MRVRGVGWIHECNQDKKERLTANIREGRGARKEIYIEGDALSEKESHEGEREEPTEAMHIVLARAFTPGEHRGWKFEQ